MTFDMLISFMLRLYIRNRNGITLKQKEILFSTRNVMIHYCLFKRSISLRLYAWSERTFFLSGHRNKVTFNPVSRLEIRKKRRARVSKSLGLLRSGCSFALLSVARSLTPGSRGVCGCREQLVVEKHPRSLSHHPLSTLRRRRRRARRHRVLFHLSLFFPSSFSAAIPRHPPPADGAHGLPRLKATAILRALWTRKRSRVHNSPRVHPSCTAKDRDSGGKHR